MANIYLSRCDNCGITVPERTDDWMRLKVDPQGSRECFYGVSAISVDLCSIGCAAGFVQEKLPQNIAALREGEQKKAKR